MTVIRTLAAELGGRAFRDLVTENRSSWHTVDEIGWRCWLATVEEQIHR